MTELAESVGVLDVDAPEPWWLMPAQIVLALAIGWPLLVGVLLVAG